MKALLGLAVVALIYCAPTSALAQDVGSTISGAAKQAGAGAAGQVMQQMGLTSPSPTASPAATPSPAPSPTSTVAASPAAASSPAAQMPGGLPSVPQIPGAGPSPPGY